MGKLARTEGKMELLSLTSELMPKGAPNFLGVMKCPPMELLRQEKGANALRTVIIILVRDLCNSVNVVRNMNEDQIIEAACMLLDECGDFRLEDYVMMFSLAKRGNLVKIFDRLDIETIGKMLDAYWQMRYEAGKQKQEQDMRDYENNLYQIERQARIERARVPETEEEKIKKQAEDEMQDRWFAKLKELAKGLQDNDNDKVNKYKERDEMIKKHQQFLEKQVEARSKHCLQQLSALDENKFLPDSAIIDMEFILRAQVENWEHLLCNSMKITNKQLHKILLLDIKDDALRISFIKVGKQLLGI